ncbi:MAG: hypothetical protein HY033_02280 [Ignavibacteriae bacterium]|nr:hypothetical protein [Ignavibacteria bacterium]MBI3363716.1 hypothetical protein [Ignavibacteriota bacterium]
MSLSGGGIPLVQSGGFRISSGDARMRRTPPRVGDVPPIVSAGVPRVVSSPPGNRAGTALVLSSNPFARYAIPLTPRAPPLVRCKPPPLQ